MLPNTDSELRPVTDCASCIGTTFAGRVLVLLVLRLTVLARRSICHAICRLSYCRCTGSLLLFSTGILVFYAIILVFQMLSILCDECQWVGLGWSRIQVGVGPRPHGGHSSWSGSTTSRTRRAIRGSAWDMMDYCQWNSTCWQPTFKFSKPY